MPVGEGERAARRQIMDAGMGGAIAGRVIDRHGVVGDTGPYDCNCCRHTVFDHGIISTGEAQARIIVNNGHDLRARRDQLHAGGRIGKRDAEVLVAIHQVVVDDGNAE